MPSAIRLHLGARLLLAATTSLMLPRAASATANLWASHGPAEPYLFYTMAADPVTPANVVARLVVIMAVSILLANPLTLGETD